MWRQTLVPRKHMVLLVDLDLGWYFFWRSGEGEREEEDESMTMCHDQQRRMAFLEWRRQAAALAEEARRSRWISQVMSGLGLE